GQRVFDVVEEAGVSTFANPLVEASSKSTRKQIGEREKATLAAVEHIQVLDGLVNLAVLEIAHAVAVVAFQEHSNKGMEEVQVLGRRLQREGVDSDAMLPQPNFQVSSAEERRQLAVAVAHIEDDCLRHVFLRVRDQEVEQKTLTASGRTEHEHVA